MVGLNYIRLWIKGDVNRFLEYQYTFAYNLHGFTNHTDIFRAMCLTDFCKFILFPDIKLC